MHACRIADGLKFLDMVIDFLFLGLNKLWKFIVLIVN
jgi:hypothetical protein